MTGQVYINDVREDLVEVSELAHEMTRVLTHMHTVVQTHYNPDNTLAQSPVYVCVDQFDQKSRILIDNLISTVENYAAVTDKCVELHKDIGSFLSIVREPVPTYNPILSYNPVPLPHYSEASEEDECE